MNESKDPFEWLGSETLNKAEALCGELDSRLSIDRRTRARYFPGSIVDQDADGKPQRPVAVTVAETTSQPWVTLITEQPLSACRNAVLSYKVPPGNTVRYEGRHKASEPGKRGEADQGKHVVRFDILKNLR
ncbi:MAG: hypothetical protein ACXIUB_12235 [Wenzhouxiangella sp.]